VLQAREVNTIYIFTCTMKTILVDKSHDFAKIRKQYTATGTVHNRFLVRAPQAKFEPGYLQFPI
jgi:hypothetical protein